MESNDQSYQQRENLWDEQWPENDGDPTTPESALAPDNTDEELPFPGTVGARDATESVRDAEPYIAPIDPPVLPGGAEGIHVGTGFGSSVEEENAQEPAPRGDEDIRDEAMLTLEQDSLTSALPLEVDVEDGVVTLRGRVQSEEDAEHAQWLLGELRGVVDVVDDTVVTDSAAG